MGIQFCGLNRLYNSENIHLSNESNWNFSVDMELKKVLRRRSLHY
jgi:hypothetical protein